MTVSMQAALKSGRFRSAVLAVLLCSILALITSIILLASVPPVSRDALTHHLYVPKLYLQHGAIYEIPDIAFSYYPMNLDLLYLIPLYFGNDIAAKYIHFFFGLLTAWLLYEYLKTRLSPVYGLLGALFFLSIPIIVKLSITAYVDLGLIFFSTASLLLLFRWLDNGYRLKYLLLAGICCGLAAGTKYNGLVAVFLLTLFVPILYIRSSGAPQGAGSKGVGYGLLFLFITLLVFSPWLLRNYAWTGNPIYPLHNSLFQRSHSKTIEQQQPLGKELSEAAKTLAGRGRGVFVNRKILYHETGWQALLLPLRFFFEGRDDDPRYFDGKLNPFLLLLPFFAFVRKSPSPQLQREKITLFAFSLLFFFFTFFQESTRIRYISPVIPPMVILSMMGLNNIITMLFNQNFLKGCSPLVLASLCIPCFMLAYNANYLVQQFSLIRPFSYIDGAVTRDEYITRFRPEYPVIQYANEHVSPESKVLCLFLGGRGYYMDFQPIFENPGSNGLFADILKKIGRRESSVKDELYRRGITHVLIRNDLTTSWYRSLDQNDNETVGLFFKHDTALLYQRGGYSLFRLQ